MDPNNCFGLANWQTGRMGGIAKRFGQRMMIQIELAVFIYMSYV